MKKIIISVVILLAAGGLTIYELYRKATTPEIIIQKPVIITKAQPEVKKPSVVTPPQPAVESGYVIGVVAVSKSVNGELISIKISNDGDTTLVSSPDTQFKLVGAQDGVSREPIPDTTSGDLNGQIPPNKSRAGIIKFDSFVNEASQLRFYPDPAKDIYIVVPLIPMPEGQ